MKLTKQVVAAFLAMFAVSVTLTFVQPIPVYAAVLWSSGDQTAGDFDSGFGNPPTGNGCYFKYDTGDGTTWSIAYWGANPPNSQSQCESGWNPLLPENLGVRWNGSSGSTTTIPSTTTTIPPSTTTTIASDPRIICDQSLDHTDHDICTDAVHVGEAVNTTSCSTASVGDFCSPSFISPTDASWQTSPLLTTSTTSLYWKLKATGGSVVRAVITKSSGAGHVARLRTGLMCFAKPDGHYALFDMSFPNATVGTVSDGTLPKSAIQYMYRGAYPVNVTGNGHTVVPYMLDGPSPPTPTVGMQSYPEDVATTACEPSDPVTTTKPTVATPAVDCYREMTGTTVRIRAIVANTEPLGASDTLSIQLDGSDYTASQFFPEGQHGDLVHEFAIPLGQMPTGGWRGTCMLTRKVNTATHRGSNAWKPGVHQGHDLSPSEINSYYRDGTWVDCGYVSRADGGRDYNDCTRPDPSLHPGANKNFVMPPVAPLELPTEIPPGAIIPAATGGADAALTAAPIGINVATLAGIPAAALFGWSWGGAVLGVGADLGIWTGDDLWFCRWNPGYRLARLAYCEELIARDDVRSVVQLQDKYAHPVTGVSTYDWTTGVAVAEVLVNPLEESVGRRTTTAIELPNPQPDPDETAKVAVAVEPDVGTARAVSQTTPPDPTKPQTDPIADPRPTLDPVPPPPDTPPNSDGCELSLWDFLNPFNIASTMACFLKYLFIPDSGWSGLTSLWGDITSRVPFVYLKQAVLFIPSLIGDLASSTTDADCANLLPHGLNDLPGLGGRTVTIKDKMGCPDNNDSILHPVASTLDLVKNGVFLIFVLSMAFAVYHLIIWAIT